MKSRSAAIIALGLTWLAPPANTQTRVATGVKETHQPDGVLRFDRPPGIQPSYWQLLFDLFRWKPAKTPPFRRSVAFLAGVGRYDYLKPQLPFVESDLTELRTFLLSDGGFDTVFEVRNDKVRRSLIEDYMVNKFSVESRQLGKDDRLLFYYSGHGADKEGVVGYLQFSKATQGNFAGDEVLPVRQFQEWAKFNVAKHLLIILDACASGLAVSAQGEASQEALLNALSGEGSGFLLTAGTGDQKAWQVQFYRKGYSVFTRALLDALRDGAAAPDSTGLLTINEVEAHARKYIGQFEAEEGHRMDPQLWPLSRRNGWAKGTFVFLNAKARNPQIPQRYAGLLTAELKGGNDRAVTSRVGIIEVFSPAQGILYIDGQAMGYVLSGQTRQFLQQAAGEHQVELKGTVSETREVIVKNGAIAHAVFGVRSPIDTTGTVPAGTLVFEAIEGSTGEVYIDSERVGHLEKNGRLPVTNVTVGTHIYRIDGPEGQGSTSSPVQVEAGQTKYISIRPNPPTNLKAIVH